MSARIVGGNLFYKIGNRFNEQRIDRAYGKWAHIWYRAGIGKYWKRLMHKADRKWVRGTGGKERSFIHYSITVNYRNW